MPDEYEVKIRRKSEAEKDLEEVADKVQAGAKAVANEAKDVSRDLDWEYKKEKLREKLD